MNRRASTWLLMRRLQAASAVLLVLQGVGHTFLGTPQFFDSITQPMIWFAGAGLGGVFLGLLNLFPPVIAPRWLALAIVAANLSWFILMLGLLTTSHSVRVIIALVLTAGVSAGSIGVLLSRRKPPDVE